MDIPLPETLFLQTGATPDLCTIFQQTGWRKTVERYGGQSLPVRPEPSIIRQATAILDKTVPFDTSPSLLYARVDGVMRKDIFTLMELELVEPSLFINNNPMAIRQFVYFFNSSFTAAAIC
ncbi:MAG TPA: hypothetical protein VHC48_04475 [Puia sp.]|nr:hypothetical protein [Puia sp.]